MVDNGRNRLTWGNSLPRNGRTLRALKSFWAGDRSSWVPLRRDWAIPPMMGGTWPVGQILSALCPHMSLLKVMVESNGALPHHPQ